MSETDRLRHELKERARAWAMAQDAPCYASPSAVVFFEPYTDAEGRLAHGNFETASYGAIQRDAHWKARLMKPHPKAPRGAGTAFETDSCTSSDALLMSTVCHPESTGSVTNLLGIEGIPEFGVGGGVPRETGGRVVADETELDLVVRGPRGRIDLIVEAKLTERDFTKKRGAVVHSYVGADRVFHPGFLDGEYVENYQLVRNMLAAAYHQARFVLLCDQRRPDLVSRFDSTVEALRDRNLAQLCNMVTWQEIAAVCGSGLRGFLSQKYGITRDDRTERASSNRPKTSSP